jgi:hypothetical protein
MIVGASREPLGEALRLVPWAKLMGSGCSLRERQLDSQTIHEITLVMIATLVPVPLITTAVVAILIQ